MADDSFTPAEIETLAVVLFESDCRRHAFEIGKQARSRTNAYHGHVSWSEASALLRQRYRVQAIRHLGECRDWAKEQHEFDGGTYA